MEISKLTLTKETKEKMKKSLSSMDKGRLMWGRVMEAEKDGRLQQAKDRNDIASIAGYTERRRGYSWVSNLIKRGAIVETFYAPGEYTYTIGKAPKLEYVGNKTGVKNTTLVKNTTVAHPINKTVDKTTNETANETISTSGRIVIEFGEMRITMENVGVEYAKEIIKTLK